MLQTARGTRAQCAFFPTVPGQCSYLEQFLRVMASKIFNDPVHKHMELSPMCVKILNTPQFQRLRHVKQLDLTSYVYPGANHTRFEHSIGVCYLAGKVVRRLQEVYGKIKIPDQEATRVEIAGLCHDLGHGPMSHSFEKVIGVNHEEKSWEMFQLLIDENNLGEDLIEAAGSGALVRIKDLIHKFVGKKFAELKKDQQQSLEEHRKKHYLYQIVANDDTGVDVDRWDYFARDTLYLGLNLIFQYDRILPYMRICNCIEDGKEPFNGIAYRDKVKEELLVLFRTRFNLFGKAYLHRVTEAAAIMTVDAFRQIKDVPFLRVPGESELLSLKKASEDIKTYQYLDDRIVKVIQNSTDDKLKPAKDIFDRINRRDFYTFVGQLEAKDDARRAPERVINALKENGVIIREDEDSGVPEEVPDDLEGTDDVHFGTTKITDLHYGQKDQNPFDAMFFYSKYDEKTAQHATDDELPLDLPKKWRYRFHRFYVKTPNMPDKQKKKVKDLVGETLNRFRRAGIPVTPHGQMSTSSAPPRPDPKRSHSPEVDDEEAKRARRALGFGEDNF